VYSLYISDLIVDLNVVCHRQNETHFPYVYESVSYFTLVFVLVFVVFNYVVVATTIQLLQCTVVVVNTNLILF
jgi:hypothetical protein